ncbi:hypothetical protein QN277_025856 [Acacia crassicarpa]|uniref:Uncharacterized protein n=1 Tax=Acacia crassicarpa TaxID=499986 RepID=A0AAE1J8Y2_9FABA|nr:hypothetical protein QN277_025856 [Acacia crassicarpa]
MEAKKESTDTFERVAIASSVEEFHIVVNGVVLDSQLSTQVKTKYYELCCSQGTLIHEHLPEGQNYKLVVGMISEMVNIADAIRASSITTPLDSFAKWYTNLKGLKVLGMKVTFLLTRLENLISLATKASSNSTRYAEVKIKQDQTQEEKKILERKLEEVKKTLSRLDAELDSQNLNLELLVAEFQYLVNASW